MWFRQDPKCTVFNLDQFLFACGSPLDNNHDLFSVMNKSADKVFKIKYDGILVCNGLSSDNTTEKLNYSVGKINVETVG